MELYGNLVHNLWLAILRGIKQWLFGDHVVANEAVNAGSLSMMLYGLRGKKFNFKNLERWHKIVGPTGRKGGRRCIVRHAGHEY